MHFLQTIIYLTVKILKILPRETTMLRLLTVALVFSSSLAFAQTTLDITLPGGSTCSYVTGPVSNGSAPGHLQATATSESGAGCTSGSSGSVTFGPASPATAAPASLSSNTGTSSINFQVLNASTCVGTFNPTTGASFTGSSTLCSGTSCQSPVSAIANFDNETASSVTYGVTVTCNGTAGQAVSTTSVVVPAKGQPGSCFSIANVDSPSTPFTRASTAALGPYPSPSNQDATSFVKAFGDSGYPTWPGHPGLLTEFLVPQTNYISLAFSVPPTFFTGANLDAFGSYTVSISGYSAPISMSISTKCGDFSPPGSTGSSTICRGNLQIGNGSGGVTWGTGQQCPLSDNGSYFLNFINADITNVTANGGGTAKTSANKNCSGGKCEDVISNGPAAWH
jgi:hypothetical protein